MTQNIETKGNFFPEAEELKRSSNRSIRGKSSLFLDNISKSYGNPVSKRKNKRNDRETMNVIFTVEEMQWYPFFTVKMHKKMYENSGICKEVLKTYGKAENKQRKDRLL